METKVHFSAVAEFGALDDPFCGRKVALGLQKGHSVKDTIPCVQKKTINALSISYFCYRLWDSNLLTKATRLKRSICEWYYITS